MNDVRLRSISLCAALLGIAAAALGDVVVVFNEVMYHPVAPDAVTEEAREWIELRNQMAIDIEMSGWSLAGGVNYTFPLGTILPAGGYLVVAANPAALQAAALGPWSGRLANDGESLELRNKDGRVMDRLSYGTDGDWPSGPDGGGTSLAKRAANLASESRSWVESAKVGGSIGAENFPAFQPPTTTTILDANGAWRYRADGTDLGTAWTAPAANEDGWSTGNAGFHLGGLSLPAPALAGTLLPSGPVTYYFRRAFDFGSQLAHTQGKLRLLVNDGAAVYLNGTEVARFNLPPGAAADTPALNPRRGALAWREFAFSGSLLQPTGNVLAVEVHQAAVVPSYAAALLAAGPVAYWRLDENSPADGAVTDLAHATGTPEEGEQNGTLQGLPAANLPVAGPRPADNVGGQPLLGFETANGAAAFQGNSDGGNDVATFPDSGVLNFSAGKKFTVHAWVKGSPSQEEGAAVFCKGTGGGGEQFSLDMVGGRYRFFLWNGGNPNAATVAQSTIAPNNTWQHVAIVFDQAAGIMRFYVNGVQAATATPPATLVNSSHEISVGARKGSAGANYDLNFNGVVDEVAIFNRALSASEITEQYNAAFLASPSGVDTMDAAFAGELMVTQTLPTVRPASLVLNEISTGGVELMNVGPALSTAGFAVVRVTASGNVSNALQAQNAPSGGIVQVPLVLTAGDRVVLLAPDGATVLDSMEVKSTPRGRSPDGTGAWYRPLALTPGAANNVLLNSSTVISEIMFDPPSDAYFTPDTPRAGQWIELHNKSTGPVDLQGWSLADGVNYTFPAGATLAPGSYITVAANPGAVTAVHGLPSGAVFGPWSGNLSGRGERLRLEDAAGNLADEVRYAGGGRWPEAADGGGSTLELRDAASDNSVPEAWAASDESGKAAWQTFTWRGLNVPSQAGEPTLWREINLLLMDGPGECLIDDVRVTDTTTGANLIQNGDFSAGPAKWRLVGNHRTSRVESEPGAPGNQVLHLIASGAGEYQGNQIESTYAGNQVLVANREYEISLRARWLSGGARLNTRLYFNRLPRTNLLAVVPNGGTPGAANSRAIVNLGPTYARLGHLPVVPQVNEPVSVSVDASDPQGIATMTLHYSVAGGAWQSVPMTNENGRFSAAVPGQAARSVVQFYVEGVDASGAVSTFPANGASSRALYVVQDGQATGALVSLRLVMTTADATFLHAPINTLSNEFVGATVIVGEREVYYDVGVRLKGSFVGRNVARVGFNIRFGPDQLFRGVLDKISVDRSQHTAISVGEIISKHVGVAAGGIPSMYDDLARFIHPLVTYTSNASLRLAGFDEEYLDSQFTNGSDGQMFEFEVIRWNLNTVEVGNPESQKLPGNEGAGTGFANLEVRDWGNDKEAYRWTALQLMNRDEDEYAGLIALEKLFSQNGATFAANAALRLDVESWLRTLAYQSLVGPADAAYTGSNIHNFRFYIRPNDGLAMYLPWDWDSSFQRATNGSLIGTGNLAKAVTSSPDLTRRYYSHLYHLVQTTFNTAYMGRWTQHYGAVAGQNFSSILTYIGNRASFALSQSQLSTSTAFSASAGTIASNGTVPITGSANIAVAFIEVNGITYAPAWSSNTNWSIVLPLSPGDNLLTIRGLTHDRLPVTGATSATTVNNPFTTEWPALRINEWLAENDGAFRDLGSDSDDWFEIHNPTAAPVNLAGWKLTDQPGAPTPFLIPDGWIIPAGGYLLVWADDEPVQNPGSPATGSALHVSFRLGNGGDTILLSAPDGRAVDTVIFSNQRANRSEGRFPDGSSMAHLELTLPTPGAANALTTIDPPIFGAGGVTIRFTTTPGVRYTLQRSADLLVWENVGAPQIATGPELSITDQAFPSPQGFYRVELTQ